MNRTKKRNLGRTVWIFFIVIILIIIAGLIVTSMIFKNSDVTPSAFGYSVYVMDEEGMGEAVPEGSLVIAKNYSPSAEDIGDAILCENVEGYGTAVLRLADIIPNTKTVVYQAFFDNDPERLIDIPAKNLVGQAVSFDRTAGAVIRFITSYQGMATLVVVPILILLVCELIIGMYSKKAEKEARNAKYRRKMRAAENAAKSPLNPAQLGSHKTPVTIDEFIFGQHEQQEHGVHREGSVQSGVEETTRLMNPVNKDQLRKRRPSEQRGTEQRGTEQRVAQRVVRDESKVPQRVAKPVEQRVRKQERSERTERPVYSQSPEKIPAQETVPKTEIAAEKALKPQPLTSSSEQPKAAVVSEAAKEMASTPSKTSKSSGPSYSSGEERSYKSSNESLAQLIKLMEEQERILKEMADNADSE